MKTTLAIARDPRKVNRSILPDMAEAFRFTPADATVARGDTVYVAGMVRKVVVK